MKFALLTTLILTPLFSQTSTKQPEPRIQMAELNLQLGTNRESVLAKLAVTKNTRLKELGADWYEVLASAADGSWTGIGDVIFRNGKLTRICLYVGDPTPPTATSLAMALYVAIKLDNGSPTREVSARTNSDGDVTIHEIHLLFTDHETVISSSSPHGVQTNCVQVYYPAVLAAK